MQLKHTGEHAVADVARVGGLVAGAAAREERHLPRLDLLQEESSAGEKRRARKRSVERKKKAGDLALPSGPAAKMLHVCYI